MYKSRIKRMEERIAALEERADTLERAPIPQRIKIEVSSENNSVGGNIKARRMALGMEQTKLAEAVGISQSLMAQFERGSKVPNVILAKDIAKVLQCDLEELVKE